MIFIGLVIDSINQYIFYTLENFIETSTIMMENVLNTIGARNVCYIKEHLAYRPYDTRYIDIWYWQA